MNFYPSTILNAIRQISRLPGIGEKTAERLVLHILHGTAKQAEALADSIKSIHERTRLCTMCFSLSDSDLCGICSNPSRNPHLLCVVEQPADMVALEKSGAYNGLYHVLQGVLSPIDGIAPENIRIKELIARIAGGIVKEVVIATSTHLEGEATASYIADQIKSFPLSITRIATGIPVGGDLKYVDQVTLKKAMDTRHAF